MKKFVVGDIHGAHKALVQCLQRSAFNVEQDLLISLGDVCDGWPEVDKVIGELLRIKNIQMICGNHDAWMLNWIEEGIAETLWKSQGGLATMAAYQNDRAKVPASHTQLLKSAKPFLELDSKLFTHGGFNPDEPIEMQDPDLFLWDRSLLREAVGIHKKNPAHLFGKWTDIYIGHTPTQGYATPLPLRACNLWALDTGAGWSGKLTLMNIDSHEYWQSDSVPALYPNAKGRQ